MFFEKFNGLIISPKEGIVVYAYDLSTWETVRKITSSEPT